MVAAVVADLLLCVRQPLVPQGTAPDLTARLGVVPHHLQPKDPRVRAAARHCTAPRAFIAT